MAQLAWPASTLAAGVRWPMFPLCANQPCAPRTCPLQLLGAMAHCAPKQLGSCLPVVVPRLGEVLADPHPKVASAAKTALNEVSLPAFLLLA